jgi:hypothetical protein
MSISISGNGSFTGANSDYSFDQSVGIAGTLTYEDVTNIDSVGVITARSGINVGPTSGIGITLTSAGNITAAGNVESSYLKVVASPLQSSGGLVRIDGSTDRVIELSYDGSATFAGGVEINGDGDLGTYIGRGTGGALNSGFFATKRDVDGTGDVAYIQGNAGQVIFKGDGSATFGGNLTANAKKLGTGAAGTGKVVGYQQGTWTPVYAESGNLNNEATNYATRTARWWRIGDVVTVTATLNLASSAGISPNNALVLKDFPYICQNVNAYYGSSSSVHANGWVANTVVFVNILVPSNTTKADLYYTTSAQAGNYNGVDYSKIGTGSMIFNLSYLTDDTTWTPVNGAAVAS